MKLVTVCFSSAHADFVIYKFVYRFAVNNHFVISDLDGYFSVFVGVLSLDDDLVIFIQLLVFLSFLFGLCVGVVFILLGYRCVAA